MATKVLLYEDNENLRKGVLTLLLWNDLFDVVAAHENANKVIKDIETWWPDVILMDIEMPLANGVDAVVEIRKKYSDLPIIMFTVFEDDENIYNAICAGANGYILKKNIESLPTAILEVLDGGAPITGSVAKKILSFVAPKKKIENNSSNLTEREIELLELIVKGFSYKMIASELSRSKTSDPIKATAKIMNILRNIASTNIDNLKKGTLIARVV